MILEFFHSQHTHIQLTSQPITAYIYKAVQRDFTGYSKLLVQINNNSKNTPDRVYLTMHGTSQVTLVKAHLIVYSVKEWSDTVSPFVYDTDYSDQMFKFKNDDMFMNTDIDMENNKIINTLNPTNGGDVVNKRTLDAVESKITDLSPFTKDYVYRKHFDQYYSPTEPSHFRLVQNSPGVVIQGIKPNLFLGANRLINDFDRLHGLQMNNGYINLSNQINQNTSFTIFVYYYLSNTCEINFTNNINSKTIYRPSYKITNNQISISTAFNSFTISYTSELFNKQVMVWKTHDSSQNLYKIGLSNYSSHVSKIFRIIPHFQSSILKIKCTGHIKNIGFVQTFIDVNSLQHHDVMLEEMKNGSYFE